MNPTPNSIVDYEQPPVQEVALSVQFESLRKLDTRHIGLLWQIFSEKDFKKFEEHPPLNTAFEIFGDEKIIPRLEMEILDKPPLPRSWFVSSNGSELIQIQKDRFAYNWRRDNPLSEDPKYPRYKVNRQKFIDLFKIYENFLAHEEIGEIQPNQCEITYVNPIFTEDNWEKFSELYKIFKLYKPLEESSFLPEPETVSMHLSYVIHTGNEKPVGRLHISTTPVFSEDKRKVFLLKLIARGKPINENLNGIIDFFDLGRTWIVKAFTELTTDTMHKKWGYENGS